MTNARLSQRRDLVEGMDAEGVIDFLSFHGVLDPKVFAGLDKKTNNQKNIIILRQIEQRGHLAVSLLIDALRRSWQLQLANGLDSDQKIKPTPGSSYFREGRLKGEITIIIETEALKLLVPEDRQLNRPLVRSLPGSPIQPTGRILNDTVDSVLVRDEVDGVLEKDNLHDYKVDIKDDADEEDFVKPRSCWCFCLYRKNKSKTKSKKDIDKQQKTKAHKTELHQTSSADSCPQPVLEADKNNPKTKHRKKKQKDISTIVKDCKTESILIEGSKKSNNMTKEKRGNIKTKSLKSKSKIAEKYSVFDTTDGTSADQIQEFRTVSQVGIKSAVDKNRKRDIKPDSSKKSEFDDLLTEDNSRLKKTENQHDVQYSSSEIIGKSSVRTWGQNLDKNTRVSSSVHYNPKLQLVKLGDGQTERYLQKIQYNNIDHMCEKWICEGKFFQEKSSKLCRQITQELRNEIIKYFERVRGILVWDVVSSGTGVNIVCICMQQLHVKCLHQDLIDGSLLSRMQHIFSKVDMTDVHEMKLRTVVNEQELNIALEELS